MKSRSPGRERSLTEGSGRGIIFHVSPYPSAKQIQMELGLRPHQNEPKEAMAKSPRFAYGRLVDISRLEFVLRESRMTSIGLFLFV